VRPKSPEDSGAFLAADEGSDADCGDVDGSIEPDGGDDTDGGSDQDGAPDADGSGDADDSLFEIRNIGATTIG
jgi:hypothetical protein